MAQGNLVKVSVSMGFEPATMVEMSVKVPRIFHAVTELFRRFEHLYFWYSLRRA